MSYATNADVQKRLGAPLYLELTDDGTGVPDEEKVNEARIGAEGEVDSYLARRYAVPIDTAAYPETAGLLRSITLDLTEFRLRSRKPPVAEEARLKREDAIAWLGRIASGQTVLPAATELPGNPAIAPTASTVGGRRILTAEEMEEL